MRFDPDSYPGSPPAEPLLLWRDGAYPLDPHRELPGAGGIDAPVLEDPGERRYVLAYGSNADLDRLRDKGLDRRGVLVLPAAVIGWTRAWEARRSTSTGAVPLTLLPAEGERLDTHVLGVHPADLDRLDASEFRGSNYVLAVVEDVAVAARWHLRRAYAYRPTRGTQVLLDDGGDPLTCPPDDQAAAAARLGDDQAPVEEAPEPVDGWPVTPIGPMDLFVYGSLQPGEERWEAIAALVEVVGPATATGGLWETGHGWPAARFAGGVGEPHDLVQGTLLRPRGAGAAARLYRAADAIEAEGELFRRVAARVQGPSGAGWAASYEWHPDRGSPSGCWIDGGRWSSS